jgi:hypothetical protein
VLKTRQGDPTFAWKVSVYIIKPDTAQAALPRKKYITSGTANFPTCGKFPELRPEMACEVA